MSSTPYRILIVDPIDPSASKELHAAGFKVATKLGLTKAELVKAVPPYHAIIGRTSTKLDADVLAAAKNLRCIGVHATGWDHIDIAEATRRGIVILGFPQSKDTFEKDRLEGSFIPTAEYTLMSMLAAANNLYSTYAGMKAGRWEKYQFTGIELHGKTLGIIGLGRIGSLVASRAAAFGMKVVTAGPRITAAEAKERGAKRVSMDELLAESDFITVHVPKTETTAGLLGKKEFARMKKGVVIINTSRAAILNQAELLKALESGKVRMAALDVFDDPASELSRALISHPRVLATPHIAGVSEEGTKRVSRRVAAQVTNYLTYGRITGIINPEAVSAAK